MTYSDKDLQIATEIAYFDLHFAFWDIRAFAKNGLKLTEAIDLFKNENYDNLSNDDIERLNLIIDYLNKDPQKNWKIIDFKDDNNKNQSGLYGIVIDTGDGLIVSFRGSEDITDPQHVKQDWVNADLALMNNTLTEQ
ncbi:hypothetical protein [Fervidibacillus halotolerans]|uniref:Uncharacterized protein n=1 Tax=Fervidibacillus halotolerans TaxID=2980027 RepID=A0A9E8S0D2_9BACI|nr:hypothetical protein [Fervidibacillus halotolerans]WAA12482.1 hypothetical protein OE105_13310 [Fervidibacillus halotolerans]